MVTSETAVLEAPVTAPGRAIAAALGHGNGGNGDAPLRTFVRRYLAETHTSQTDFAKRVGSNPTSISKWLAGAPVGDWLKLERAIKGWFEDRSLEAAHAVNKDERFIETDIARKMRAALERTQATRDCAVITAPAGAGKSEAIRAYRAEHVTSIGLAAFPWTGGCEAWAVERKLLAAVGSRGLADRRSVMEHVVAKLADSGRLIIVDDAHDLFAAAIALLVKLHDVTGCPLALVGNGTILELLRGRSAAQREKREQIDSRAGLRLLLVPKFTADQVRAFVEQYLERPGAPVLALARRAAAGTGHLRTLDKALRNVPKLLEDCGDEAEAFELALAALGRDGAGED